MVAQEVIHSLKDSINTRLKPYYLRTPLLLFTLLDSKFKKNGFRTAQEAECAIQVLPREYAAHIASKHNANQEEISPPTPAAEPQASTSVQAKIDELLFISDRRPQQRISTPVSDAIIDIRQYMEKLIIERNQNTLAYCKFGTLRKNLFKS